MPVLSPSGMLGEAGPAVSSIETSGWQPRHTRWLMILSAALGWLLSLGRAPQATSGCTVATHSCAIAIGDQASNAADTAKPDALTAVPFCGTISWCPVPRPSLEWGGASR